MSKSIWAAYCPERRREVRCGCKASESVLCSRLPREAPWAAFAPVGDGSMEYNVAPHFAEDPVALLC